MENGSTENGWHREWMAQRMSGTKILILFGLLQQTRERSSDEIIAM